MKIHKLVLLSSVLILPTQELLAGNARNLAQTAASKSTVVAPAQATVNSKVVAPSRIEATSSANETPVSPPPSSMTWSNGLGHLS
ncbi:hypothetical protein MNBD_GAMMA26-1870 [hydrothermal vent metagenome]|uniref:Uncharacterized protein n=1 Tax=hydrothermal vent metagenome TaxID=652676 RepID=A0A3B1BD49_9ZZZZ